MRPAEPVPGTWLRSTLLSFAILRTSGDERTLLAFRRRCRCRSRSRRSRRRRGRSSSRFRGSRSGGRLASSAADHRNDGVDADGRAFRNLDLGEDAGDWRRNLRVDLVGGDLKERLVALDRVADLLQPLGDRALGDGLAHLRHQNFGAAGRPEAAGAGSSSVAGESIAAGVVESSAGVAAVSSASAGAAGGAATEPPAPSMMTATTVLICTVAPSAILISCQRAGGGRRNLGVHLVGGDLKQRLVALQPCRRLS